MSMLGNANLAGFFHVSCVLHDCSAMQHMCGLLRFMHDGNVRQLTGCCTTVVLSLHEGGMLCQSRQACLLKIGTNSLQQSHPTTTLMICPTTLCKTAAWYLHELLV